MARKRLDQVYGGRARSYIHVLRPAMVSLLDEIRGDVRGDVLDVGCGIGHFTVELAKYFNRQKVTGIDVSSRSIELAQMMMCKSPEVPVEFETCSVEELSATGARKYDLVTANMMLMTTPSLASAFAAFRSVLRPGGWLLFSVTHPFFWAEYWDYRREPWFRYERETCIESPLKSGFGEMIGTTTHYHRPLSAYMNGLTAEQFCLDRLLEPTPEEGSAHLFAEDWTTPRFLVGRALLRK